MPIKSQENVLGIMSVVRHDHQASPFNSGDKEYLELLANILALDLEYRRLAEEQSKQQAASMTLDQVNVLGGFLAHKVPSVLGTVAWTAKELDGEMQPVSDKSNTLLTSLREVGRKANRLIEQCRHLGKPLYLQPEVVHLLPLIQTALRHVEVPQSIHTTLDTDDLPSVKVNPSLLVEVIEGIIQNAYDAMLNGGALTIKGEIAARNSMIRLHVNDTGHGISPEHASRLFTTPFFTTKTESGGLGFGLWLSQLYLQSIGGDINLTQTSSEGSTFTLSLPIVRKQSTEFLTEIKPEIIDDAKILNYASFQVLIVEDEIIWQSRLAQPFLDQGCQVQVAGNSGEAMNLLNLHNFSAFVVDVRLIEDDLNNMDGLNIVKQIRERDFSGPILVLSVWDALLSEANSRFEGWENVHIMDKLDEALDAFLVTLAALVDSQSIKSS